LTRGRGAPGGPGRGARGGPGGGPGGPGGARGGPGGPGGPGGDEFYYIILKPPGGGIWSTARPENFYMKNESLGPRAPRPGPRGSIFEPKIPPCPPPRNNWGPCGGAYRGLGSQQNLFFTYLYFFFYFLLFFLCSGLFFFLICSRCELVPCSRLCCPRCTARSSLVGLRFETATVCWTRTRPGAGGPGPGPGGRPGGARGPPRGPRGGRPGRPPGRGAPGAPGGTQAPGLGI